MMYLIDPNRVDELTEQEKWECTARWLGYLYNGYFWMWSGELTLDEFLQSPAPCSKECRSYEKCPAVAQDPYRPFHPIYSNFQVMEKIIPGLIVVNLVFPREGIQDKDNAVLSDEDCS